MPNPTENQPPFIPPDHPGDFIFPLDPVYAFSEQAPQTKKLLQHQRDFLAHFATMGNDKRAAAEAGISRDTVLNWKRDDSQGFNARYALAQASFGQFLEGVAYDRIMNPTNSGRTGSDVLLIFLLNGNMPDKYKRDTRDIDDSAQRLLDRLRGADTRAGGQDGPPRAQESTPEGEKPRQLASG
jgi:hypothetical protein